MTDKVVRDPVSNPFAPGYDAIPDVWAGRARELADFTDVVRARRLAGVYERGRAFMGQPGIGKSVLVNRIAREAETRGDIVLDAVRTPKGANPLALLAHAITQTVEQHKLADRIASHILDVLATIASLRLGEASIGVSRRPPPETSHARAVTDGLIELGRIARSIQRIVLVRLDEVQNVAEDLSALSALLIALSDASTATVTETDDAGTDHWVTLPVVVYLTGLPNLVDNAESDAMARAGVTFGRRFAKAHLDWLEDSDVRVALAPFTRDGWPTRAGDPVHATDDAIDALVHHAAGDPFVLQLLGSAAWNANPTRPVIGIDDITTAVQTTRREVREHIERFLAPVPARERQVLTQLIGLPADRRAPKQVATALGYPDSSHIGTDLRRLEDRSLIRRDGRTVTVTARLVERHLTDP